MKTVNVIETTQEDGPAGPAGTRHVIEAHSGIGSAQTLEATLTYLREKYGADAEIEQTGELEGDG